MCLLGYKTVRYKDFKSSYACLSKALYQECFVYTVLFSRHLSHCIRRIELRTTPAPKAGACLRPNAVDIIAAGVFMKHSNFLNRLQLPLGKFKCFLIQDSPLNLAVHYLR